MSPAEESLRREIGEPSVAADAAMPPAPPAVTRNRLRATLRSRAALREAFLLREILGPPVSLRDRTGPSTEGP